MDRAETLRLLDESDEVCSAQEVQDTLDRMARAITARLAHAQPLVLSVMGGAVVFTGQLLPRLSFPLDFDYIHVTRYGADTHGGTLRWIAAPDESVAGRTVLVLDDILDEGITLAAIRERVLELGARECFTAVLTEKLIDKSKPIQADFVGLKLPDRYVFGFGMDVSGVWRNLPSIRALRQPG